MMTATKKNDSKRTWSQRLAAIAAVGAVVFGVSFIGQPAFAAKADCPRGYACMWEDSNYNTNGAGGAHVAFKEFWYSFSGYYYSGTGISANNSGSSLLNNGNYSIACWYDGIGYSSSKLCLNPLGGARVNLFTNLAFGEGWANNAISSGKFV